MTFTRWVEGIEAASERPVPEVCTSRAYHAGGRAVFPRASKAIVLSAQATACRS